MDRIKATWEQFYKDTHDWGYCVEDLGTSAYLPSGGSQHKTKGVRFLDREGGAALYRVTAEGDVIILDSVSRAFRSMSDCWRTIEALQGKGVKIHFRDIPAPAGSLMWTVMLTVLSLVAEMESAMKSQRMRERAEWARKNGKPVNQKRPFGKKLKGRGKYRRFVDNPSDLVIAARVRKMREEGGLSFAKIADALEREHCEKSGLTYEKPSAWKEPKSEWTCARVRKMYAEYTKHLEQREGEDAA
jgi:DNA invertase Pin-like site-specific DNA recombinase